MSPVIRSACCSAALLAVASCGGKSTQNESGNAAGNTLTAQNAASTIPASGTATSTTSAPGNGKLMTIEALPVSTPGPGTVMGTIHMIPAASGIETDGYGGGCLAFADPANQVCHKDSDCHVPSYMPAAAGPWAYCADQKCWIKPDEKTVCWKSRYFNPLKPLAVGKQESTPPVKLSSLPAQLFTGPAKNQTKVRVIACLNGKYDPNDAPPCAGGTAPKRDDVGDVRTVTK